MLGDITRAKNVYIVCGRTDMRKGIRGLAALVRQNYRLDPFGYLLYLLQELPKLGEKPAEERLYGFLPWSESLPAYCRKK